MPLILLPVLICLLSGGCSKTMTQHHHITSPSGEITVTFLLSEEGAPSYLVRKGSQTVIDTSGLGFDLKNQPPLHNNFRISDKSESSFEEKWEMPWGEQREVTNSYQELQITLEEITDPGRTLQIIFRVFNDGIGFRYYFPEQERMDRVHIMDELTEFRLTGDHTCWWIPADYDSYEHLYSTTPFSEIDAIAQGKRSALSFVSVMENAVHTPVTMRTAEGLHLSFHEAALTDYASMTLKVHPDELMMTSSLVGSQRHDHKVVCELPFNTPWRTIQITGNAKDLIASNLIVNLNEPSKLDDVSWFKPQKYVGIWWEMHLGKSTWAMSGGRHGATTENAKRYIDFAASNNIRGVLVEGWYTGWEQAGSENREGIFDFVTPYSDYALREVVQYARERGVELIIHHETESAVTTYEEQLDTAFALMEELGLHVAKPGYVGRIIPEGEYHHGQWMVNHYRKALKTAAKHKVALNVHEPIKDTGIRRTYPNMISREGVRGQEFNAWARDGGNPPEHIPIVAFTRMLAGPIDYTPGVFDISLPDKPNNQVNTTVAHQLALYVVIYSPVQMACDLPENYTGKPAFQFIRDVGVDWDRTLVLDGEIGDFVIIARKERSTGNWFLGAVTDEERREIQINFSFLDAKTKYRTTVYRDGQEAHYRKNPEAVLIEEPDITSESVRTFRLAEGGGLAISIIKE